MESFYWRKKRSLQRSHQNLLSKQLQEKLKNRRFQFNQRQRTSYLVMIFYENLLSQQSPAEDLSVNKIDTMSEAILESGQSPDLQETICFQK